MEVIHEKPEDISYDDLVKDAMSSVGSDINSVDSNDDNAIPYDLLQTEKNVYDGIIVHERKDKWDCTYYVFDDKSQYTLNVVVFSSTERKLVNLNGTVVPLSEFFDVTRILTQERTSEPKTTGDLRSAPPNQTTLTCKTSSGSEFTVSNVSIPMLMKAITVLSDAAEAEKEAYEEEAFLNHDHVSVSVSVNFVVAAGCAAFSFLAGLFVNNRIC